MSPLDQSELFLGPHCVLTLPRVQEGPLIHYRHIIDRLIRKPGAFEDYKVRQVLGSKSFFSKSPRFYDALHNKGVDVGKRTCQLLFLSKMEGEQEVTAAIDLLLEDDVLPLKEQVKSLLDSNKTKDQKATVENTNVTIGSLEDYDSLLTEFS
jgi:hypothetical protein